jgi:CheY-like chemotaxis protein
MQLSEATILVVDDEADLLLIFKSWLERAGCVVLTAEHGGRGLEIATSRRVDAIISDIRMPVMNGIELARNIKSANAYIPKIIFISGFGDISDRECFDLGIEVALAKPVRRADLIGSLRQTLMDRAEAWREPPAQAAAKTLDVAFESIGAAKSAGLMNLGRGGFCVRSKLAVKPGDPIGLRLAFRAEDRVLTGAGVARWTDLAAEQIGIEIRYVGEEHRGWLADLVAREKPPSFIPRNSWSTA